MADATKTILMVGGLGVGGYLAYEYYQYSNAINSVTGGNANGISAIENALPFFTFVTLNLNIGTASAAQAQIMTALQGVIAGTLSAAQGASAIAAALGATATTPGTTSSGQASTTSVSSAPPSTTTSPAPPAPQPISKIPIYSSRPGMATSMQHAIQMTIANADQWNYAYTQVNGKGIDAAYGFNFDTVYGAVVNGARASGTMSAQVFLQMANAARTGMSGVGAIATFAGPALISQGNMIYQAHHPFPYIPTYTLRGLGGLGAMTQASGFEKALFARQPLRSNRIG